MCTCTPTPPSFHNAHKLSRQTVGDPVTSDVSAIEGNFYERYRWKKRATWPRICAILDLGCDNAFEHLPARTTSVVAEVISYSRWLPSTLNSISKSFQRSVIWTRPLQLFLVNSKSMNQFDRGITAKCAPQDDGSGLPKLCTLMATDFWSWIYIFSLQK